MKLPLCVRFPAAWKYASFHIKLRMDLFKKNVQEVPDMPKPPTPLQSKELKSDWTEICLSCSFKSRLRKPMSLQTLSQTARFISLTSLVFSTGSTSYVT